MKVHLSLFFFCALPCFGVTITGGSDVANNRFSSGFPSAPVQSTNASFVGLGYNWSGVAWSTTTFASSSYKGLGMLGPSHFLTAQHYEYVSANENTKGVRILNQQGSVITSGTVAGVSNTGQGLSLTNHSITNYDVAVGRLTSPLTDPTSFARMGVIDLHNASSSNTLGNYTNLPVFLYGRSNTTNGSPRVGSTTIDAAGVFNSDANQIAFRTVRANQVQLEVGDSGAPALHGWTNPNGGKELTLVGVNSAVDATYNYVSMLSTTAAINATNSIMVQDGFALRLVGNVFGTWNGGGGPNGGNLGTNSLWSNNSSQNDRYVLFDSAQTSVYSLNVNANLNMRGLYFRETASTTDGFTFGGASILTIGRGGITNYDNTRQVFNAALTLGDHQYWDVGVGGVTVNTLNTNAKLLEIAGSGTARFNGAISGTGGMAVTGARVELMGTNSYNGNTWVHAGVLNVGGSNTSSPILMGAYGRLEGSGSVGAISGSGRIDPGNSPGILTATSVNPAGGLDFHFEFTSIGSPAYGNAGASVNDVLRLTGGTPFTSALSAANAVNIYLDVSGLNANDTFRGGFYTDTGTDFLSSISSATFTWYLANVSGTQVYNGKNYNVYGGPFSFALGTVSESANFGAGVIGGQVMTFTVIPEVGTLTMLALMGSAVLAGCARRRKKSRLNITCG